jgi:hypothetical protein
MTRTGLLRSATIAAVFAIWTSSANALSVRWQLVENGDPRTRIMVADDAPPAERYAAEELQRFLREMSGAEVPIVSAVATS